MIYRREIDGLRALAVLPVILFHAGFESFSGGFVGVDIFFVISGYLITSILIAEKEAGTFSLIGFYERRARRILPALFAVIATCIPFAWAWLLPGDMKDFTQSVATVVISLSNVLFFSESGYFEASAELKPLLHTWSLAVEEQYYLLFPPFMLLAWRFGKQKLLWLLAAGATVSLALAQWSSYNHPAAAFFLLPTRAWELAIGACVACYFSLRTEKVSAKVAHVGSAAGLLLILYAVFAFSKSTPFPGLYALVPTIGAALIILFATPATAAGTILSNKVLVGIGLLSYSAYLWHQPIFAFIRYQYEADATPTLLGFVGLFIIPLSYLTWRYIEGPFRDRACVSRRGIFIGAGAVSAAFFSFGLAGNLSEGFKTRLTQEQIEVLDYQGYEAPFRSAPCFLNSGVSFENFPKECESTSAGNSLMVWGDSYAAALSTGLRKQTEDFGQYTASGCPPLKGVIVSWRPNCADINQFVLAKVEDLKPAKLLLHANWSIYDQDVTGNLGPTILEIRKRSPKTNITIVGLVPQWKPSLPITMAKHHIRLASELFMENEAHPRSMKLNAALGKAARESDVNFLSLLDKLCIANRCRITVDGSNGPALTTWDYGHLTEEASAFLAKTVINYVNSPL